MASGRRRSGKGEAGRGRFFGLRGAGMVVGVVVVVVGEGRRGVIWAGWVVVMMVMMVAVAVAVRVRQAGGE